MDAHSWRRLRGPAENRWDTSALPDTVSPVTSEPRRIVEVGYDRIAARHLAYSSTPCRSGAPCWIEPTIDVLFATRAMSDPAPTVSADGHFLSAPTGILGRGARARAELGEVVVHRLVLVGEHAGTSMPLPGPTTTTVTSQAWAQMLQFV